MKSCGKAMRLIAIIAFIGLCVCSIISYAISMDEVNEQKAAYAEDFAEHRAEIKQMGRLASLHNIDNDCSTCEKEEALNHKAVEYFVYFTQSVLTYLLYCGILYVLGEMAMAKASCKAQTVLPQEPVPPAQKVCPNCGNVLDAENHFCNKCGVPLQ